jgi:hypothetical protein
MKRLRTEIDEHMHVIVKECEKINTVLMCHIEEELEKGLAEDKKAMEVMEDDHKKVVEPHKKTMEKEKSKKKAKKDPSKGAKKEFDKNEKEE